MALFALLSFFGAFTTIAAGERGILTHWGAADETVTLDPGLVTIIPWVDGVVHMSIQTQLMEATKLSAASSDAQEITTDVAINYRVDPDKVNWLYKNVGVDYRDIVIDRTMKDTVKTNTAKFTAIELVEKRSELRESIFADLKDRLSKYNVILETVSIPNFKFNDEFQASIESKVQAEQDSLAEKNKLEKEKYIAQQVVVRAQAQADSKLAIAKADAEALRIKGEALRSTPELVNLNAVDKWDGKLPTFMSSSNGVVPFMNIDSVVSSSP